MSTIRVSLGMMIGLSGILNMLVLFVYFCVTDSQWTLICYWKCMQNIAAISGKNFRKEFYLRSLNKYKLIIILPIWFEMSISIKQHLSSLFTPVNTHLCKNDNKFTESMCQQVGFPWEWWLAYQEFWTYCFCLCTSVLQIYGELWFVIVSLIHVTPPV